MIIRLRSRDGLERIEVQDNATIKDLKHTIHTRLSIPLEDMRLSKDPALLTSKSPQEVPQLQPDSAALKAAGVAHGEMLYMLYSIERQVEPVYRKSVLETRRFGEHITISDVIAKQVRIERQEKARIESVSFDRHAADSFQSYVQRALSFNIKRGGLLYGRVEEGGKVMVDFIYEPPQEATAVALTLNRRTEEEAQVDFLAGLLGYKKVGWIFSQSKAERDFIMHTEELLQTAAMQDELGETCATVVVSWDDNEEGGHVHFEAFQCSEQCVKLAKDGWLLPTPEGEAPKGVTRITNPKEPHLKEAAIIASKDSSEVDNDYFLCPASITSHDGRMSTSFPIENRLLPQGKTELREYLKRGSGSYVERLSDFHLLLWLSKQPNLDPNDMILLCDAVKEQKPVLEGYRVIIDSIAGI
mmetsp:Transcript_35576/g.79001  ORF Transcript_35576/g.79001 Transcript_35576/m.79001 type:complete len:414 (+) Transcript_35576:354-1595(+)|eukprot:CAMPEP_0202902774 /NCGR_PEP_ID=MMETSP1392-20130828/17041_1 /ASSEMBLY_ACC=CAM_ASM_000868 /TAXON_ID=225041 /ORGANISM="Chlamydomonas chlamydogama, Strain SAG 11-48b" /LENGTH=413 /DNA_ID=CAMNT_0049589581 /DNA_START=354 /DNA_END=1595 /DNA_ORIENTATION=-